MESWQMADGRNRHFENIKFWLQDMTMDSAHEDGNEYGEESGSNAGIIYGRFNSAPVSCSHFLHRFLDVFDSKTPFTCSEST
jgi:hypothetical protein